MTYEEIASLGDLVNITVTKEESADLIPKMSSVLGYIDQIKSVDVQDVKNKDWVAKELREDVPVDSNFKQTFLAQVPNNDGEYVKVFKVLGSE